MQTYLPEFLHDGETFLSKGSCITIDKNKTVEILIDNIPPEVIEVKGIICPAFVNAHCHLELSYLKRCIPQHTGFVGFAQGLNKVRHNFSPEKIHASIADAITESKQNGIQAIGDICNSTDSLKPKINSDLQYHNFIELFGIRKDKVEEAAQRVLDVYQAFASKLPTTIVPHATYSLNEKLWLLMQSHWGTPCSIHNQESMAEDNYIRKKEGPFVDWFSSFAPDDLIAAQNISPLQYALQQLGKREHLLLVHNTFTVANDILTAQKNINKRYWITCPSANLYIENTMPDNYELLQRHLEKICIGTDSLASNDSLDIWKEIMILHQQKNIPLEKLLNWATFNGAEALCMPEIGRLAPGSESKVIWIQNTGGVNSKEAVISYL
jgi:aminodeoxyfutalosine deaminase